MPLCSVVNLFGFRKLSEIRTDRSDFRHFFAVQNPNKHMFERSDFGQLTKLGRFIYKDRHEKNIYLYKTV